jgi:hypothetical protein
LKRDVLRGHARLRNSFCTMKSRRRGFGDKGQCISWGSIGNYQFESGQEGWKCSLPAFLAFVDIGVKVDIGYVTVKHRTSGLDHTIRKLGAHAHRVSTGEFSEE